jgi:CheY-specific phosphatase CheX
MMRDINAARGEIADVVSASVVETFNAMFGQTILANNREPLSAPNNTVISCVKLVQGRNDLDFCFKFDMNLLLLAASGIFTPEYLESNPVHEDIACEIGNIVCAKVKAYLNANGFHVEMGFPFIPQPHEAEELMKEQDVHMHFFFKDKEARQGVGVAVNFTVA